MSDTPNMVSCIGRGDDDGCGHSGGRSGDTCPECGGMMLSESALREAAALNARWRGLRVELAKEKEKKNG